MVEEESRINVVFCPKLVEPLGGRVNPIEKEGCWVPESPFGLSLASVVAKKEE